jgi:hypothetical protein
MIRPWPRLALVALLLVAGCSKDKPKPDEEKKAESVPVPSGMVFNDFLPTSGGAAGLGVRDAGLEGGLAGVSGAEPGEAAAGDAGGRLAVKLLEPGAEPRALRKYSFVPNKIDHRVLTITQSMSQSARGQTTPPQEVTIKISLDVATKQVKPAGATLEVKVTKVELPGAPPQATQMLAAMNGLKGTFDVTSSGDVGEVQFAGTPQMQNQLAETILGGLSQAVQLLLTPLPASPIGVGAKWELSAKNEGEQNSRQFTLKEVSNDGALVETDIDVKMPRRLQQSPRGGPPMAIEADGKGKYTQTVRFNQVVTKADGEITINDKVEINDPKGGGKQTMMQTQKSRQTIETPGAK